MFFFSVFSQHALRANLRGSIVRKLKYEMGGFARGALESIRNPFAAALMLKRSLEAHEAAISLFCFRSFIYSVFTFFHVDERVPVIERVVPVT